MQDMSAAGELYEKAENYYTKGDYAKAADHFARSFNIFRTSGDAALNAAACYALVHDTANAFRYLRYAIDLGKAGFENDPDFSAVARYSTFQDLAWLAQRRKEEIDKQPIKSILKKPQNLPPEIKLPVIILFHDFNSSPQKAWNDFKNFLETCNCLVFIPSGSKILGWDLFDWEENDEEYQRIKDEIEEFLLMQKNADKQKVILMGFGKGGFLANSFGMLLSEKCQGIINWYGTFPTNLSASIIKNKNIRFWSFIAANDNTALNEKIITQTERLAGYGIQATYKTLPGGHYLPQNMTELLTEAMKWLLP